MLNRHGLVAGATGTGKTKTLQLLAEQLSDAGVPVFAADIKGDLSGLSVPGQENPKVVERAASVGQKWQAQGFPVEFFALGGQGIGTPLRVTMSAFGPTLLAEGARAQRHPGVLARAGLPLRRPGRPAAARPRRPARGGQVPHLRRGQGRPQGPRRPLQRDGRRDPARADRASPTRAPTRSSASRSSRPATSCGSTPDGKGLISLVELPNLQDRPALFSTFLMWLLADLFHDLPEVGDVDKPKLVFFFDEAHLLFDDASKAFLDAIAQTVRLIRSKGVGVFFVTQSPTDVPDDVLAQLGSRIQHQLRAATPNDAKALKQTVNTYPHSDVRRPRPGDPLARHRRGDRDGDERARRADPGRLDAAACPGVADGRRRPRRDGAGGEGLAAPPEVRRVGRSRVRPREARRQAGGGCREGPRGAGGNRPEEGRRDGGGEAAQGGGPRGPQAARASPRKEKSMAEEILTSTTARQLGRTAVREIFRGMFKTGRR